jgi:hypothetical protein
MDTDLQQPAPSDMSQSTNNTLDLGSALATIGAALAAMPPALREAVALNLAGWAREGGASHWQPGLLALLDLQGASQKLRRHAA